jgi:20S proteasome alpha/beta subunit
MTKTFSRASRLLSVVVLYLAWGATLYAHDEIKTSRGTVNIAISDANGLVLLTDSAESHQDADGWHHTWPVQKLFRLDDRMVCSIAGFGAEKGWPEPKMNTYVSGIIAEVRDQLAQKPVEEFDAKLSAVGFLVANYLDILANRQEVMSKPGGPINPDNYRFEVIGAGYDRDGTLRLKKLIVALSSIPQRDGTRFWTHTVTSEEATTKSGLTHLLAGIPYVSRDILEHPAAFAHSPAVARYAQFRAAKSGKQLELRELSALAREMARQTSRDPRFNGFVGGPDQIAILAGGRIQELEQPAFPEPPRPMKLNLIVNVEVTGPVPLIPASGTYLLWIRSNFIRARNPALRLDNQFFYGCEIRDSIVEYGGGLTDFGPTNKISDTMLLPGHGGPDSSVENITRISRSFPWRFTPPELPPLTSPSTIQPRRQD